MRPDSRQIAEHFKDSLDAWVREARPCGGFLTAVLENNLCEAIGRGDEAALDNLMHVVAYLYNECPADCWGSRERVDGWPALVERRNGDAQEERDDRAEDIATDRKTEERMEREQGDPR